MSDLHRFNGHKILVHADRLHEAAHGGMPYPLDWHIYPSNLCNHSCGTIDGAWCMFIQNGEQEGKEQLSKEVLHRAVADAYVYGAVLVHFSGGGEPLLNKHTLGAMQLAQNLGESRASLPAKFQFKVALSTNGSFLTTDVVKQVDYIRVSLNAGTADQHTRTNHAGQPGHKGDFDKICQNIADAVATKRGDIGLAFVVDHQNWRDIEPFIKLGAELGVDFVHIRPAFFYQPHLDLAVRNVMPQAFAACERGKEAVGNGVKVFALSSAFDGYWTPRTYDSCKAVLTGICLRATGDFAVCQDRTDLSFGADYCYGKTFPEIWGSQEHKDIVAKIVSGGELDKCPRCVWNKRNEIIHQVFGQDSMRLALV